MGDSNPLRKFDKIVRDLNITGNDRDQLHDAIFNSGLTHDEIEIMLSNFELEINHGKWMDINYTITQVRIWRKFILLALMGGLAFNILNRFVPDLLFTLLLKCEDIVKIAPQIGVTLAVKSGEIVANNVKRNVSNIIEETNLVYNIFGYAFSLAAKITTVCVSGVYKLLTIDNLEFALDIAAATGQYQIMKKFLEGGYDENIARIIINAPQMASDIRDATMLCAINSAENINASRRKVLTHFPRDFVPDRDLDVGVEDYIREHFKQSIAKFRELKKNDNDINNTLPHILQNLSYLGISDDRRNSLIRQYGPSIVALWDLYTRHRAVKERVSVSQERGSKTKRKRDSRISKSLPRDVGPDKFHPGRTRYERRDQGNDQDFFFGPQGQNNNKVNLIDAFKHTDERNAENALVHDVLGQLFDPSNPAGGNIFTNIINMRLSERIQTDLLNIITLFRIDDNHFDGVNAVFENRRHYDPYVLRLNDATEYVRRAMRRPNRINNITNAARARRDELNELYGGKVNKKRTIRKRKAIKKNTRKTR